MSIHTLFILVFSLFCGRLYGAELDFFDNVDELQTFITRGQGLIYQIKEKTDTLKLKLSQSDIVDGAIALNQTGTYIFMDNIMADLAITGTNITLDLSGKSLIGTINITGSATIIKSGEIVAPPAYTPQMAEIPALSIASCASLVRIKECHISCLSSIQVIPGLDQQIAGRDAVRISGLVVDMKGCSIGAGTSVSTTTTTALDGGTGIIINGAAKKIRIFDCILVTGDGGSAVIGNGGNGGHGMHIKDSANQIEIRNCSLFGTGNGGAPNGNGGHGIIIESGAADVAIYDCHIRNTGAGAAGGVGGKAIQDAVTIAGNYSIIYRNVAHNIANALKFDLQGSGLEKGILSPNPPDNTVINSFANVYFS